MLPEAQEASGAIINDIIAYLTDEAEIAEEDIKTVSYNLYPRWTYEERLCPAGSYCPPGERVQDGFEVNQTVQVKVRDTAGAGAVIAGVGERGATNISGLDFTVDDMSVVQAEAREKAIADAKEQAVELAEQLGVRLVRIASFHEQGGGDYYAANRAVAFDVAEESAGFGGAALPVGENQTVVQVNVTFEIE